MLCSGFMGTETVQLAAQLEEDVKLTLINKLVNNEVLL